MSGITDQIFYINNTGRTISEDRTVGLTFRGLSQITGFTPLSESIAPPSNVYYGVSRQVLGVGYTNGYPQNATFRLIGELYGGSNQSTGTVSYKFVTTVVEEGSGFQYDKIITFQVTYTLPPITILPIPYASPIHNFIFTVGTPIASVQFVASGGTGPYTFSALGTLPPGLSLSTAGLLTGTPSALYNSTFFIRALATDGAFSSISLAAVVNSAAAGSIVFHTDSARTKLLKDSNIFGAVGVPYESHIYVSGTTYDHYATQLFDLPPGVTYTYSGTGHDSATGVRIHGTPTALGSFTPRIWSRTLQTTPVQREEAFDFDILAVMPTGPVVGGSFAPVYLETGDSFTRTYSVTGGTAPYVWTFQNLPAGITASGATISGTFTGVGFSAVTVTVTDSLDLTDTKTQQFTIQPVFVPGALTITNAATPIAAALGSAYSKTYTVSGGVAPYTWTVVSAPPGLSVSAAGVHSGTFSQAGTFSVGLEVKDSDTPQQAAYATVQFIVTDAYVPVAITSAPNSPVVSERNAAFNATYAAADGQAPLTWTATGLPPGITLSSGGVASGTFGEPGTYSATVTVTDSKAPPSTASVTTVFQVAEIYNAIIQGTLRLDTSDGAFAARDVYLYNYVNGAKVAETVSDGTTGEWQFTLVAPGEYFVVGVALGEDLNIPRDFDALGVITVV